MPSPGFFEIYPAVRPALPAGAYLLAADHDLTTAPPDNAPGDLAVDGSDFTFKIISPRYTMPPDQILSTFPPAAAVGDWRERLPQIVFKRRTLPWERHPGPLKAGDPPPAFESAPPWLALVVLAEGEGTLSPEVDVAQCVTPGVHLDGDADTARGKYLEVRESIVQAIFPTIEDLELLCHVRHVDLSDTELALGDDDGYLAVVMANRLPQPGPPAEPGGELTSVRYTAYVLNLEEQLPILPTKEQSETVFVFDVVMPELYQSELFAQASEMDVNVSVDSLVMKGLPQATRGFAAGVAAEHAGDAGLGSVPSFGESRGVEAASAAFEMGPVRNAQSAADDAASAKKWITGTALGELADLQGQLGIFPIERVLRFPVLVSWDFVCTGDGGFERLMNKLASGMLGTVEETADGVPVDGTDPALQPDIAVTGHISLDHTTRRGEATRSWYRGPLVPQPTERTGPDPVTGALPLVHTGDQLRRVVPDGHEDIGLAAAFEIGRLLALSKPGIVSAMTSWREELFGAARVQSISNQLADSLIAGIGDALGTGKAALDDLLADRLLVQYAEAVPDKVGPRAKEFASARVPDDLDQLRPAEVLTGLGVDPGAAAAAAKQFGAVGLGMVDVQIADTPATLLSASPAELGVLRTMADAHLDQLTADALKLGGTLRPPSGAPASSSVGRSGGGRGRRGAAPTDVPDDLDRLIALSRGEPDPLPTEPAPPPARARRSRRKGG